MKKYDTHPKAIEKLSHSIKGHLKRGAYEITVIGIWQFLGGETVIEVNVALYSVIQPRDGDEIP